jgi:hypothetical protein
MNIFLEKEILSGREMTSGTGKQLTGDFVNA